MIILFLNINSNSNSNSIPYSFFSYNPTANPKTIPATAANGAPVFTGTPAPVDTDTPPATPVPVTNALPSTCCTCTAYCKLVTALPLTVCTTVLDPVVLAVHPAQLVQGALELQGPNVQPGQSDPGHALPPHHFVHGPLVRHSLRVLQSLHGPQFEVPKGPQPVLPPQCWFPGPRPGPLCPGPQGP